MGKERLLLECTDILKTEKVSKWYDEHLKSESQAETLNQLEMGVRGGKLTVREALSIALIVGVQWNVNFEEGRCPKTGNYFPTKENHDKNCRWCKDGKD